MIKDNQAFKIPSFWQQQEKKNTAEARMLGKVGRGQARGPTVKGFTSPSKDWKSGSDRIRLIVQRGLSDYKTCGEYMMQGGTAVRGSVQGEIMSLE